MEQPARPRTAKVVLIGDSGTGKSALHQRYMTNTFSREYTATLGCSYQAKTIEIDGVQLTLQLWDTAGKQPVNIRSARGLSRVEWRAGRGG